MKYVQVENIKIGNDLPFVLIAGPCVIESEEHATMMAKKIKKITTKLKIPFIFKSSYDKANRTSINAYRGPGCGQGCKILNNIKKTLSIPIITDVHTPKEAYIAANFNKIDIIQIPAFLCRQTDLLIAAGRTQEAVMVKKGQFLTPKSMKNIIDKLESTKSDKIMLCERGSSFGHGDLVVDYRGIIEMKNFGYPVIFDATHSSQKPGDEASTGGNREMAPYLAKAAIAVGVAGIFLEVHNDPDNALSDGPNSIKLDQLEFILKQLKQLDNVVKKF